MKLKQFSKKTVSLILAVTMMITAVFVGTFTTTAADGAPTDEVDANVSNTESNAENNEDVESNADYNSIALTAATTFYLTGESSALTSWGNGIAINHTSDSDSNHPYVDVYLNNGDKFKIRNGDTWYGPDDEGSGKHTSAAGNDGNTDWKINCQENGDNGIRMNTSHYGNLIFNGTSGNYRVHLDQTNENDGHPWLWLTKISGGTTSSNWYLTGDGFGGWDKADENFKFTYNAATKEYTITVKVTDTGTSYLRLYNKDESKSYESSSGTQAMEEGTKYGIRVRTGNDNFTITGAGTYTFHLDATNLKFWYTKVASTTYTVTVHNGIEHVYGTDKTVAIANNYIVDGSLNKTSIERSKTDTSPISLTATLGTSSYLKDGTNYKYKIYGYSVLITLDNGKKTVASITDVKAPSSGKFTATYSNIPSNVESIDITPVYVASDAYAKSTGMNLTNVYLKHQPGDTKFFNGTYEPKYYVWRYNTDGSYSDDWSVTITNRAGKKVTLNHEPTGEWSGQKMLYVENDTYMAIVEDYLSGITFNSIQAGVEDSSQQQTFDFDEFVKLQKLGYNNITFEPKKITNDAIAKQFDSTYASKGNITSYSTDKSKVISTLTDSNVKSTFELYTNLNGYYIDVFGNLLTDSDGQPIKKINAANVTAELSALQSKLSSDKQKQAPLYGVRYGDGKNKTDGSPYYAKDTYQMEFPIRTYYFTRSSTTATMVAQMISGYGTVEYNYLPNSTITNADKYINYNQKNTNCTNDNVVGIDWNYFTGSSTTTSHQFTSNYDIIGKEYCGTPYLVSYSPEVTTNNTRVDGRWYYSRVTPEFEVNVKVGTGTPGTDFAVNPDVGTAKVNGVDNKNTVKMGSEAKITAAAKNGYKFKGYYTEDFTPIEGNSTSYSIDPVVADTTIYAVFEEVENTLTVRNDIFTDKKDYTIGDGVTGVMVEVWHGNTMTSEGGPTTNEVSVQIQTGDKYRITLYGTPNGSDTFERFLAAPLSIYSDETDYTVLADDQFKDSDPWLTQDGSTYKYTFDIVKWDTSSSVFGSDAINLQYYTDFAQASMLATLVYKYIDRFGDEKTYEVDKVELTDDEVNGTLKPGQALDPDNPNRPYCPSKDKVLEHAPEIDDLYKDCVWTCTGSEADLTLRTSRVEITAVQTNKEVLTYADTIEIGSDGKGSPKKTTYNHKYYNDLLTLTAPEKYVDASGNSHTFSFWTEFDVNDSGNPIDGDRNDVDFSQFDGYTQYDTGMGSIFTLESTIMVRATHSKFYKAWYDVNTNGEDFGVDMRDASYTREKYTDESGIVYDYVYSDFSIQFTAFNKFEQDNFTKVPFRDLLNKAEENGKEGYNGYNNINIGIIAVCTREDWKPSDPNKIPETTHIPEETLQAIISTNDAGNYNENGHYSGQQGRYTQGTYEGQKYMMRNLDDVVDQLTILGRYDYFFKFQNTEYFQNMVFTVYSYISYQEKDAEGRWSDVQYVFSDPHVLSIYAAGNQKANVDEGVD